METDRLTATVARVLKTAPVSVRAIAKRAGVSHVLLSLIVSGARRATVSVALAVAAALEQVGAASDEGAQLIRAAVKAGRRKP